MTEYETSKLTAVEQCRQLFRWLSVPPLVTCKLIGLIVTGTLIAGGCGRQTDASLMEDVAQSHIESNAPAPSEFDKTLKRDLTAYFRKSKGSDVTVGFEYLRDGPTQSGVSYPKYYLWVKIYNGKQLTEAGAVRVAAIDQTHFDITDYLSIEQIRKNPEQIDSVFPQPVCVRIRQLVQ